MRSLRTTIEYTTSCFKYNLYQRVKENHGAGWIPTILRPTEPLLVVEGKRYHRFSIELGKSWCSIEIVNPLIFPSYIRLNSIPYIVKKGENFVHKQAGRTVIISRLSNTEYQNYYVTVRLD
jgi:hypothetical protein